MIPTGWSLRDNGTVFVSIMIRNNNTNNKINKNMKKYVCDVCGWEYDPAVGIEEAGIAPGTAWENVPEDFVCPICSVGKDEFSEME